MLIEIDQNNPEYPKIKQISWESKESFHKFSKIINTIGCDQILFNKVFFQ